MPTTIEFDTEWYKIIRDIESLKSTGSVLEREFIDIASHGILQVIKENTPRNTGDFANSWQVFQKSSKFFVIGTDMQDLFNQVVNGVRPQTIFAKNGKAMHFFIGGEEFFRSRIEVRGTSANPYMEPITKAMDIMIEKLILSLVKKHWRIFKQIRTPNVTKVNLSKTVGLTGTKRNTRRGRGGGVQKAKTGRKSFKRTLSRRRRSGKFLTTKNAKVG